VKVYRIGDEAYDLEQIVRFTRLEAVIELELACGGLFILKFPSVTDAVGNFKAMMGVVEANYLGPQEFKAGEVN